MGYGTNKEVVGEDKILRVVEDEIMNRDIIEDDIQDEINNEIISEEEIKEKGKQISRQVIEDEINKERKHGTDNNESEEGMSKRMDVKEKEDGREDDIQTLLQLFNDLGIREERDNRDGLAFQIR